MYPIIFPDITHPHCITEPGRCNVSCASNPCSSHMTSRRAGIRLLAVGIALAVLSIAIDALRDLDIYCSVSELAGQIERLK